VFITDTTNGQVRWVNFLGKPETGENSKHGNYELLGKHHDTLFVKFSAYDVPSSVYAITFKDLSKASLDDLLV
jgi:hypothetical protein